MARAAGFGPNRILVKLQQSLDAGNFYEAHQLYRTLYSRFSAQRNYDELASLLYDGACKLFENSQTVSGFDLANLFIETLTQAGSSVSEEVMTRVKELFERTCSQQPELIDRNRFVQATIKWSKSVDPIYKHGHPLIHAAFATAYWQESSYQNARYHFLLSNDGENCGKFLIEFHTRCGFPSEVDLFLAQAVFQFLCYKNEPAANKLFDVYTQKHPRISSKPPFSLPLLNFVWLLLICINTGNQALKMQRFYFLVKHYQPSLSRDDSFREYLDRIGQFYFGLPSAAEERSSSSGFLSSLLRTFMGDGEAADDSDEAEDVAAPAGNAKPTSIPSAQVNSQAAKLCVKQLQSEDLD